MKDAMDTFSYEHAGMASRLETWEWDNVWWDHAPYGGGRGRLLVIGDSISCGFRNLLRKLSGETWAMDGLGTSKALDNPAFPALLDSVRAQRGGDYTAVLFNNGLHGFHLRDTEEEYGALYEKFLRRIVAGGSPVIAVLTTPVADPERQKRVIARNALATAAAGRVGVPVFDLHAVMLPHTDLLVDGVHFRAEGYEIMARALLDELDTRFPG
jgi:lysophospholipase L1-like esterase